MIEENKTPMPKVDANAMDANKSKVDLTASNIDSHLLNRLEWNREWSWVPRKIKAKRP